MVLNLYRYRDASPYQLSHVGAVHPKTLPVPYFWAAKGGGTEMAGEEWETDGGWAQLQYCWLLDGVHYRDLIWWQSPLNS